MLKRKSYKRKVDDIFFINRNNICDVNSKMEIYYMYVSEEINFVLISYDGNRIENLLYFDFIPENFNEHGRKQDGIELGHLCDS